MQYLTYDDFIIAIEQYYGTYGNDFIRATVLSWLKRTVREQDLYILWNTLNEHFSQKYGKVPGVADIIEAGGLPVATKEELQEDFTYLGYTTAGHPQITEKIKKQINVNIDNMIDDHTRRGN